MTRYRTSRVSNHGVRDIGSANVFRATAKEPYAIREEPLGTTKHVRIVGIGAGASGINMVRTLRRNLTNYEHVIYEKNEKVGGTWFENTYPGVDVMYQVITINSHGEGIPNGPISSRPPLRSSST